MPTDSPDLAPLLTITEGHHAEWSAGRPSFRSPVWSRDAMHKAVGEIDAQRRQVAQKDEEIARLRDAANIVDCDSLKCPFEARALAAEASLARLVEEHEKRPVCPRCKGSGVEDYTAHGPNHEDVEPHRCSWCDGFGSVQPKDLPTVAGSVLPMSLGDFERRCRVVLGDEQQKASPDTVLIGLLCDAVRLAREYAGDPS